VADKVAAGADPADADLARGHAAMRRLEAETRAIFGGLRHRQAVRSLGGPPLYGEVADAMADDLLAVARAWRPDVVVYDPLTYAGPWVAAELGVPAVRSLFGPDVTYFSNAAGADTLGTASLDPSPPGLQLSQAIAPTVRIPSRYVPYNGVAEVPSWLPDRPGARICLTWGTSIHRLFGERAFLPAEVLAGATALARERGAELILAITANQRPMLGELAPPVRVVESVPLDALLPTCQALIHQGGAGTTLTALRHGLPQLVLTQVFDQAVNAYQLVAAGAGLTRTVTGLSASDVHTDAARLLDDPSFAGAAGRLRDEMRAQPTPAAAVRALAELV
jgi:hypothetical protein